MLFPITNVNIREHLPQIWQNREGSPEVASMIDCGSEEGQHKRKKCPIRVMEIVVETVKQEHRMCTFAS